MAGPEEGHSALLVKDDFVLMTASNKTLLAQRFDRDGREPPKPE
ncbi:MAG: hypothetical protein ABSC37_12040 [Xanthobacteraceae bacterium]